MNICAIMVKVIIVKNKTTLEIVNSDGQKQTVEVILAFVSEKTNKQYIVYTQNEKNAQDMVILYASAMIESDDKIVFEDISDDEWKIVKDKMRDLMHQKGEDK